MPARPSLGAADAATFPRSHSCNVAVICAADVPLRGPGRQTIEKAGRKTTIRDIALEAGVSKSTVSRVLNNSAVVDAETRRRVLSVMERNRYSPSSVAQNLSRRETGVIGIVIPEIENPYFGKILRHIARLVDAAGFTLTCFVTDNLGSKDLAALRTLRNDRVRGIIYAPANAFTEPAVGREVEQFVREGDIPLVIIDRRFTVPDRDGVFFDDERASALAVRILAAAGHKDIALINGHEGLGVASARQRGYVEALAEAGLPFREELVYGCEFTVSSAYEQAQRMLSAPRLPSAVLTCSNYITMGFFKALTERGLGVPRDIELIGFDEIDAFDYLGVRYNHIYRNTEQMAGKAIDLLIGRIENREKSSETLIIGPKYALGDDLRDAALKAGVLTAELLVE